MLKKSVKNKAQQWYFSLLKHDSSTLQTLQKGPLVGLWSSSLAVKCIYCMFPDLFIYLFSNTGCVTNADKTPWLSSWVEIVNERTGWALCIFSIHFTLVKSMTLFTHGNDACSYSVPAWHFPYGCTSAAFAWVGWFWRTWHFVPRGPFDILEQCIHQPVSLLRYTRSNSNTKEPQTPAHTPILQEFSPYASWRMGFWEKFQAK